MVILDCSAAVEIARNTPVGDAFLSMIDPNEKVVAPTLFKSEIRNTFWKYVHAKKMAEKEAILRIVDAESLVTEFDSGEAYINEAFGAALKYDHSFYDMLYLCMARRNNATLFTLDKKLIDVCIEARVNCTELVDL